MLGYGLAKGAEHGARFLGASDADAKDIGLIVGSVATLSGDPSGLVYIGKHAAETHLGPAAGKAVDAAVKCYEIGEQFNRHST